MPKVDGTKIGKHALPSDGKGLKIFNALGYL